MTIDWTKPLELEDGTPVRVECDWHDGDYTLVRCDGAPFTEAQTVQDGRGPHQTGVWHSDGARYGGQSGMRVRNVAEKPALPPDWAIDKARALLSNHNTDDLAIVHSRSNPVYIAFARYIAEHEEPPVEPVDPVVEAARLICAEVVRNTQQERWVEGYLSGRFDGHQEMTIAVATINRLIAENK